MPANHIITSIQVSYQLSHLDLCTVNKSTLNTLFIIIHRLVLKKVKILLYNLQGVPEKRGNQKTRSLRVLKIAQIREKNNTLFNLEPSFPIPPVCTLSK